ncbi:MAG: uroporphyrinogen-III synthase [Candidatus Marsarchaeota archaeon]|nr:uroporphyrinogen-III synthase [Candidatus Marsarchaeota archaeon]
MIRGKTIVITRAEKDQEYLAKAIETRGGIPYGFPTIGFRIVRNTAKLKRLVALLDSGNIDYTVFLSQNGFAYFSEQCRTSGFDETKIKGSINKSRVIAIGPQTRQRLRSQGIRVWKMPTEHTSNGIVSLLKETDVTGKNIVIIRNQSAKSLLDDMGDLKANVIEFHSYKEYMPYNPIATKRLIKELSDKNIDVVIFGSPLAAENMLKIMNMQVPRAKAIGLFDGVTIAAIGATTMKRLQTLGFEVSILPKSQNFNSIIEELEKME